MIHDINLFTKNQYPHEQVYRYALTDDDPNDFEDPAYAPALGYVKESEVCAFFSLSSKKFHALIGVLWLDIWAKNDEYDQFFLHKDPDDLPLRYLACERLLPLLPKRVRKKWELMMASLYHTDTQGEEYHLKDATKEEAAEWHRQFDEGLDRWEKNTKEGRDLKKELDSSTTAFYSENKSSLRILHNVITHNIIDTSVTVTTERALLPERVTA